jgi:hydroxymethylpyrimidine pyrophosphatase-like HAD family hydrolase
MTEPALRVVATDLDGTVIQRDGTLSAATVDAALQLQEQGVPLIVATARTPFGIAGIARLSALTTLAVSCTGALGWTFGTGEPLWAHFLDETTMGRLSEVVRRFDHVGLASFDTRQWRVTSDYTGFRGVRPRGPLEVVPIDDIAVAGACTMALSIPGHDAAWMAELLRAEGISDEHATLTWAANDLLDIAPPGVDKGTGVSQALELLGRSWEECIVFGDMPNDLPMLRPAQVGIAAAEAPSEVKAGADHVVADVAGTGFASTLHRFGLIDARQ